MQTARQGGANTAANTDNGRTPEWLAEMWVKGSIIGIFLVLFFAALYLAQSLLLPVTLAFLFALILSPVVRAAHRRGIPEGLAAIALVAAITGGILAGGYVMSGPVMKWINHAPQIGRELRGRLVSFNGTLEQVKEAQKQVEEATGQERDPGVQEVVIEDPSLLSKAAEGISEVAAGTVLTLVLLLFLLASGDMFYEKLVRALPTLHDKKKGLVIARAIEREISRYLLTITAINTGLGICIGAGLWAIDVPNPVLWGSVAIVLNFVPYLGALAGMSLVAVVAMVSMPSFEQALLAPAWYFFCNAVEGQFVTPALVGRRLRINAVAVFLAIAFWGWLWGVVGVFIAVPLLIIVKVFCSHVDGFGALDEFLSERHLKPQGH